MGMTKEELGSDLDREHDDSLEIERAEDELGRELNDEEKEYLVRVFHKAVVDGCEFKNNIVVGFYDTCGNFCTKGYD